MKTARIRDGNLTRSYVFALAPVLFPSADPKSVAKQGEGGIRDSQEQMAASRNSDVCMVKSVCFDLLTGLLDSWTLWNAVAGDAEDGARWRAAYLQQTYQTGAYRPYETLVLEAAELVGLPGDYATRLAERYAELRPWPEVGGVLRTLRRNGLSLAVVTNCSERLAAVAVHRIGVPIDVVVTAERAGFYKPHPRPYLLALEELGSTPTESLFAAGSAYDLIGSSNVGIPTYWHNRIGAAAPQDAPVPAAQRRNLRALVAFARS